MWFNCCLTDIWKELCEDMHIKKCLKCHCASTNTIPSVPCISFSTSHICLPPITVFFSICFPVYWPLALLWFFIAPSYIFSKNKTSVTEVRIDSLYKAVYMYMQDLFKYRNCLSWKVKITMRNLTLEFPAWSVSSVHVLIRCPYLALNEKLELRWKEQINKQTKNTYM